MNSIRSIQTLNKRELEAGVFAPGASWHADYRDTAFVSFGGLPFSLSEGDVLTIFSQFGEPVYLRLMRDKETGKSRGFGWLKYEDQRSCDLAVDNLAGAEVGGRLLRVDHARYKPRDDEDPDEGRVAWEDMARREKAARAPDAMDTDGSDDDEETPTAPRPVLPEERELARLMDEHDDDDPMKAFLIEEKKKEVELALQKHEKRDRKHKHRHHHHHRSSRHRSRRDDDGDDDRRDRGPSKRSRRDETPKAEEGKRDATPEARDRDRDRHRSRRHHHHDEDRAGERRDRDSRRDRGDEDRHRERRRDLERDGDDGDGDNGRRRPHRLDHSPEEDRHGKSRRRSRSRSPRAHRER